MSKIIIVAYLWMSNVIVTAQMDNISRTDLNISKEQEESFKANYGLAPETNLTWIKIDDVRSRNNVDYLKIDVFTENATYMHDGVYYDQLPVSRFSQITETRKERE